MIDKTDKLAEQVAKLEKVVKSLGTSVRILQEENADLKRKLTRQGVTLGNVKRKL